MVKFGPVALRIVKDEKEHFCVALAAFDMKIYSNSTPMKFQRSRSFSELVRRTFISCQSTFSKDFPAKKHRANFNIISYAAFRQRGKEVYIFDPGHMIRIAVVSLYSN